MASRFVRPEAVRLTISGGDWLLVKKRLSAGEQRQMFSRLVKPVHAQASDGAIELDTLQVGLSQILAYLLDWSLKDDTGSPVAIRDQPVSVVTAALDALDLESFTEIMNAIQAHEAGMVQEREQEKKLQAGVSTSSTTSRSPSDSDGDTNGLTSSMPMSMPSCARN